MKELEWSQDVPHYDPMELSVAMETRVLIQSSPKPNTVNPLPQRCSSWNLIMIGQLVSEILMFESVDGRTHGRTDGRRLESITISSSWAFGSGELKIHSRWPRVDPRRHCNVKMTSLCRISANSGFSLTFNLYHVFFLFWNAIFSGKQEK